jgi:hypothetical protein
MKRNKVILAFTAAFAVGAASAAIPAYADGYYDNWDNSYNYYDDRNYDYDRYSYRGEYRYEYPAVRCPRGYTGQFDASGYQVGCVRLIPQAVRPAPPRAPSYWECGPGYEIVYDDLYSKIGCRVRVVAGAPQYASPRYDNRSSCPAGYQIAYDDLYNRIGCEPRY